MLASRRAEAHAATTCDVMTTTIYTSTNPGLEIDLLTTSASEHAKAQEKYGFTAGRGVLGFAASRPGPGLVSVSRLYNPKTVDFLWAAVAMPTYRRPETCGFRGRRRRLWRYCRREARCPGIASTKGEHHGVRNYVGGALGARCLWLVG